MTYIFCLDSRIADYFILSALQKKEEPTKQSVQVSTDSGDSNTTQVYLQYNRIITQKGAEVSTHTAEDYLTKSSIEKRLREANSFAEQQNRVCSIQEKS